MDDMSPYTTAEEIVSLARERGIDLEPHREPGGFWADGRHITFRRENDLIQYSLQGPIVVLPQRFKASASEFNGMYSESGTFQNLEQAVQFLRAWLLDRREVDELPERSVEKQGIGVSGDDERPL